ncbi:MAG: hypothetical protein KJ718_05550 [Nanoarchaeota archaeon]|nr:hypothetical protein [Nanoarchaeota archaeon]
MKNKFILLIMAVVLVSIGSVLAEPSLTVEKIEKNSIIVAELDNPVVYELVINNSGERGIFKIYTLVGVRIEPDKEFELLPGETTLEVRGFPSEELRKKRGFVKFEYQIWGRDLGILKDKLLMNIVTLEELFSLEAEPLHPDDSYAEVIIKNRENINLENVTLGIESVFFGERKEISLGPYEEAKVSVRVDKEGIEKIVAGAYIFSARIGVDGVETDVEGIINFLEKEGMYIEEFSEGFIVKKTVSKKTNMGNTPVTARVELKKDIVSRLFTTTSAEPESVERKGLFVFYVWEESIGPDESFAVEITTNYTFPFILIVLIVFIGVVVWVYSQKAVSLNKKVSLVRTKGGEFALKVRIRVKSRKAVDKVKLVDSLPSMTKLFKGFGKMPDKIDKTKRRLIWDIGDMTRGETRVYSYIIYSKLNIVGRFELPVARVLFEKEGKMKEVGSNRAFFMAEKN